MQMSDGVNDLEERTARFAEQVRCFVRQLPRVLSNIEDARQLIRSSGSVAANCIEANEALGTQDRIMRFKISRKEAKESGLWLRLVHVGSDAGLDTERTRLRTESVELKKILSAIIKKLG